MGLQGPEQIVSKAGLIEGGLSLRYASDALLCFWWNGIMRLCSLQWASGVGLGLGQGLVATGHCRVVKSIGYMDSVTTKSKQVSYKG